MFKRIALLTLVALIALSACSSAPAAPAASTTTQDTYTSTALDTSYEGALAVRNQLALGTLQLDGTPNAITADQAKTLLTLWQASARYHAKRRVGAGRSQRAARPDRRRADCSATRPRLRI